MASIGIGIIGSGFMGRSYAEAITKYCSEAELKAITGGSRAEQLSNDYKVDCEKSVDKLIARDDIAAVFIATPHHVHAAQAVAAADKGKHVMIEKPMACSVAQCDQIIQACKKAGVFCSIAFTQRSRKCNLKAKKLIDEGEIGRIRQIMEFQFIGGGLTKFPAWQSDKENLGILFGHGIHNFDRLRWFTGAEISIVYAHCTSLEADSKVEGTSMLLMKLTDGTSASFWSSGQLPEPAFPNKQFSTMIVGEKGLIDLDAYGELRINTSGEWKVVTTQEPIDWAGKGFLDPVRMASYAKYCLDFIEAIKGNHEPSITGWDGRQAVAAALGAYESSQTGKVVSLS